MSMKKEEAFECLKNFLKSLDDMVFIMDENKRYVLFHAPKRDLLLADPEEFMGLPYSEVLPKHITGLIDKNWKKAMSGKVAEFEYPAMIGEEERWFSAKMCRADAGSDVKGVISFIRDITKLKENEIALAKNYAELKKLDDLKSTILRDVSHELKTPIALVRFASSIIDEELDKAELSKSRIAKYTDISLRNADRLRNYVDAIISLSKLRSSVKTDKVRVDMKILIGRIIRELEPIAKAKGISIRSSISQGCLVYANRMEMDMLFRNLIDNAIKFTSKGSVKISCSKRGDDMVLKVKDTGRGIRKDDQKVIFSSFAKLDKGVEGLGIGLAIAKNVVKLHGGELSVVSSLGKGSEFKVVLPRCAK